MSATLKAARAKTRRKSQRVASGAPRMGALASRWADIDALSLLRPGTVFEEGEPPLEARQRLHLFQRTGDSEPRYLDGNQYEGTVQTVGGTALRPEFTGINWELEALPDGTWRLYNQGDSDFGLSGRGADVYLDSTTEPLPHVKSVSNWLIYRLGDEGASVCLRPVGGAWLQLDPSDDGGAVCLGREKDAAAPVHTTWQIEMLFDPPEEEPEALDPPAPE